MSDIPEPSPPSPATIRFESLNRATLGVNCRNYLFTATPTLTVKYVNYLGWGYNDIYIVAFFEVGVRIDWLITGTAPGGEKKELKFATEFPVKWDYRQLMIFLVEPTKLKWLKMFLRGRKVAAAAEWVAKLPLIYKMYKEVNAAAADLCNPRLDLEERLREIYRGEVWTMECSVKMNCV